MNALETLRSAIPDAAKDLRLNLGSVLQPGTLSKEQVWGTAVACAIASRNPQLRQATLEDALVHVSAEVVEDGKAAAALMGMNNVYYRFRHMVGREEYAQKPARLRMQRLAQVATSQDRLRALLPRGERDQRLRELHPLPRAGGPRGRSHRGPRQRRGPDRRHLPRCRGGAGDVAACSATTERGEQPDGARGMRG